MSKNIKNTNIENAKSKFEQKSTSKKVIIFKKLLNALLILILINVFFKVGSILTTLDELKDSNHGFISEIGDIKEQFLTMGDDLNEARGYLRLPKKTYLSVDIDTEESDSNNDANSSKINDNKLQLALFKYVNHLAEKEQNKETIAKYEDIFTKFIKLKELKILLTDNNVDISDLTNNDSEISFKLFYNEGDLVTYSYDKKNNSISKITIKNETEININNEVGLLNDVKSFLKNDKTSIIEDTANIKATNTYIEIALDKASDLMAKKDITFNSNFDEKAGKYIYNLIGPNTSTIGQIIFNTHDFKIQLVDLNNEKNNKFTTDIEGDFKSFVDLLDTTSLSEKKAKKALNDIKSTLTDSGFIAAMKQYNLSISSKPREENNRLIFDIKNSSGDVISGIALETKTGVVNIIDVSGKTNENLLFFDPTEQKKNFKIPDVIPNYTDVSEDDINSLNILVAGKHGNLLDTMIFVHIDEANKNISMISIPRDLMYKGRKINAYAYFYGMPELVNALSDITGYKLDKYILIDMYSFIDVIDIIGGIDITLKNAVIDPTYRVVDNGVEGTLHYEPGDYHLTGVQALRLARSRHTSSDFARASRQQMILQSIKDKALNFGFGDADTLYEIAKTVLSKTETDIGIDDAISYYFRYASYDIKSNNVMSSGNVLYSPPYTSKSKCDAMVAAAITAGKDGDPCVNDNHAYTLQPRDGNWNVIKWFFKKNFEN